MAVKIAMIRVWSIVLWFILSFVPVGRNTLAVRIMCRWRAHVFLRVTKKGSVSSVPLCIFCPNLFHVESCCRILICLCPLWRCFLYVPVFCFHMLSRYALSLFRYFQVCVWYVWTQGSWGICRKWCLSVRSIRIRWKQCRCRTSHAAFLVLRIGFFPGCSYSQVIIWVFFVLSLLACLSRLNIFCCQNLQLLPWMKKHEDSLAGFNIFSKDTNIYQLMPLGGWFLRNIFVR